MIKEKEVAFLKTTGEAVFVLAINDPAPKLGDKDLDVAVRRPISGQNGIRHEVEKFHLAELESFEDQKARFMTEREEMLKKYGPKTDQLASDSNLGFGSN